VRNIKKTGTRLTTDMAKRAPQLLIPVESIKSLRPIETVIRFGREI
jgi:hypothetical protein